MKGQNAPLTMRVHSITYEAEGVNSYDLRPLNSPGLVPAVVPGAHIDVTMGNGITRSYSLINPGQSHRFEIAVGRDLRSRGGSKYLHDCLRVGETVQVAGPRNNFQLRADAVHSVLIAGGIGVTPIFAMIQALANQGRSWELHYSARSRRAAAFLEPIVALAESSGAPLHLNFDDESGRMLDIANAISSSHPASDFYACGPEPMLAAFEIATRGIPDDRVHLERFAVAPPLVPTGAFKVVLARSGEEVIVSDGKTILQSLLDHGIDAPHSCTAGVCGTCEVKVLAGVPDHRDFVLDEAQRAKNDVIMICCSGCKGDVLVLDM